jgi:hypothetical protein
MRRSWQDAVLRACAALTVFLCVWCNQGRPLDDWLALQRRMHETRDAGRLETLWAPVSFVYRRASDETLYFMVSGAMLGKSIDRAELERMRSSSGATFAAPLPPADGHWHAPYAEVPIEYPPLVLPFILAPRLLFSDLVHYCWGFGALMGLCLVLAVYVMARAWQDIAPNTRTARRIYLVGGVFALHGAITIQRLDPVTTLLFALTTASLMRAEARRAGLWLGLAAASKFLPILLVPAAFLAMPGTLAQLRASDADVRRAGRRAALSFASSAALGFGIGLAPLLFFSPRALADVLQYHGARGLHVESVAGSLVALSQFGHPLALSFGSYNLAGPVADALARGSLVATLVAIGSMLAVLWSRHVAPEGEVSPRAGTEEATRAPLVLLLGMALLWTTGKVFSPQYLTWGIPLLVGVPARAFARLTLLYAALVGISHLYFRGYYDAVYLMEPLGIGTLWVRNVILGALLVSLLRALRSGDGAASGPAQGAAPARNS